MEYHSKPYMTYNTARSFVTQELLERYSFDEASTIALHLLHWVTQKSTSAILANPDIPLTPEQLTQLTKAVEDHLHAHKPLQYSIGSVPFLSATIQVRPPILIPRPETEWWVDLMIQQLKKVPLPLTLLDLCTGSGCIAISLAQAFPEAQIYAVDKEPQALKLAKENALLNECPQISFIESDLFDQIPLGLRFDCIVSNPPYISYEEYECLEPEVRLWEDPQALCAAEQGLSLLRKIIEHAPSRLTHNTSFTYHKVPQLALEIGKTQSLQVTHIFNASGFTAQTFQDLAHKDRLVTGLRSDE